MLLHHRMMLLLLLSVMLLLITAHFSTSDTLRDTAFNITANGLAIELLCSVAAQSVYCRHRVLAVLLSYLRCSQHADQRQL